MTTQAAFRTQHPDIVTVWDDYETQREAWRTNVMRLSDQFDSREIMVSYSHAGAIPVGVKHRDRDDKQWPPMGLRFDTRENCFVPALRTAEGKAIRKLFASHTVTRPRLAGMPKEYHSRADKTTGRGWIYWPNYIKLGDWVWTTWGCGSDLILESAGFDPELWEHTRLSVYAVAVEADGDA